MDIGDCISDSFDFEVSPLYVDRSLRSSYNNNNIMNNKTGVNAIIQILSVCGCQPATRQANAQVPRGSIGGATYRTVSNHDYL